jgi:hypothetical protein
MISSIRSNRSKLLFLKIVKNKIAAVIAINQKNSKNNKKLRFEKPQCNLSNNHYPSLNIENN